MRAEIVVETCGSRARPEGPQNTWAARTAHRRGGDAQIKRLLLLDAGALPSLPLTTFDNYHKASLREPRTCKKQITCMK